MSEPTLLAGTAVLVGRRAVLLRGESGSGKSSLALELIAGDGPRRPIRLVADDAVLARPAGDGVLVSPPPSTLGLIEIRGAGIAEVASVPRAALGLVIDLVAAPVERLPDEADCLTEICGVALPRLRLDSRQPACAAAVLAAVAALEAGHPPPFGLAVEKPRVL